ncbi:MAG: hypothetical protein Q7T04_07795, partial [Dehalococcoidia bacterium]|nr:hypothetical protein [Dehalococcoidia bacterium]
YVPEVTPIPPTLGQRYLFYARPWGWGVFPGKLLGYRHPSRFALQGGMATVEDQYFVRATKDKYYPSKPEADFLAEVQAAIVRNPTYIPDLIGSQ